LQTEKDEKERKRLVDETMTVHGGLSSRGCKGLFHLFSLSSKPLFAKI